MDSQLGISEERQTASGAARNHNEELHLQERLAEIVRSFKEQAAELEETQARLRNTEAWYGAIFKSAPDGMVVIDSLGVISLVNTELCRMFGYDEQELLGQAIEILVAPDGRPDHVAKRNAFGQSMRERRQAYGIANLRGCRRDGSLFDVDISLSRLPSSGSICAAVRDCTTQKELEKRLRQALDFTNSTIAALPDILLEVTRDGIYVNAWTRNPASLAMSPEQLIGRSVHEVLEPEVAAAALQAIRDADENGTADGMTVPIRQSDGEVHWFEHHLAKKAADNPRDDTFLVLSRDVTARIRNEEKRFELQRQLQVIADNLPGAITYYRRSHDGSGQMLFANRGLQDLFGFSPEELAEDITPMERRIHPDDLPGVAKAMNDATRDFSTCNCEFRVIHPDRGELWVHHVSSPLKESDGSILWFGMMFDITEKRRSEAALIEKEREFRTLVENSPDAIARFGTDMRRLYANPAAARFLGASPAVLLGARPTSIPGGKAGTLLEARLADVFASGEAVSFEYSIPRNDGTEIHCLATFSPEVGDDGHVRSVLAASRDITELSESRMKVHQMAFYDVLTHLPNRALFNDRLHQLVVDAAWHRQLAAVMMIDLDRFKTVNDTFGHSAGDQLLREAAARLVACVRAYDTVARLGGDEFAVLLPEVRASADIGRVATKILAAFDAPFQLGGKEVFVSCSIGIAMFPEDTKNPSELLSYADSAMYVAKRAGRNGFRFYSPEITAKARERLTLEAELRHALERRQMAVFYQPKVALAGGEVVGSEALLRWQHPEFGMVPPDRFIPVAEDTGIILDIGRWVLLEACRQATLWNAPDKPPHKVAINVSARQFQARNMAELVACTLSETACRPEWIELEITESLLLDKDGSTYDAIQVIRNMGVTIAIDDFGTGYSALSYLTRFPIDVLKIDRSFIRSATSESYRGELVRAILSIARCLGQQVVAEGVETLEQAAFLDAHGCQMAQGYLFSKPLPPEEFALLPRRFRPQSQG